MSVQSWTASLQAEPTIALIDDRMEHQVEVILRKQASGALAPAA